ncbi:hypothetical protein ACFYUY_38385 [Kitasatospora sp. NPDC004745]|uniref:hypothetical protein n=1 Tax=Kitasatospora sp. NPDC004745 TaxID=3364019 RepID=UPI0036CB8782
MARAGLFPQGGAGCQLRRGVLGADAGAVDERLQSVALVAGASGVGELGGGPVHPAVGGQFRGGDEVERAAVLAVLPGVGDEGGVDPADVEQVLAPVPHGELLGLRHGGRLAVRRRPRVRRRPVGLPARRPGRLLPSLPPWGSRRWTGWGSTPAGRGFGRGAA